ncbi:MAG: TonB-dependent receptor [Sedimenticola sp.]
MKKASLPKQHRLTPLTTAILLTLSYGSLQSAHAEEATGTDEALDTISVTASRIERGTKEVPAAITVIDQALIDKKRMFNIKDAIQGIPGVLIDSKSSSYSTRLIIRGAGQKANYGVREIMVIRDGVPMTDPDSFSRFDFIDTQDIERIEVTKGPGSLYGSGSAGGTIQVISKSVFDTDEQRVKAGIGGFGTKNLHARIGGDIDDNNAYSITASHRETNNNWRDWNKFDTQQISFKHGLMMDDDATLESELSYTQADLQLPTSMTEAEFETYKQTGEQHNTSNAFQNSGRYSTIWFFNSRYEQEIGDITFKPRVYVNTWDHFHPVTGGINDNPGTHVFGTDLEFSYNHNLLGESTLVGGVTARLDKTDESRKYQYWDIENGATQTASDRIGSLMESESATNTLYGLFLQETLRPNERTTMDIGFRYDVMNFDIHSNTYTKYNYGGIPAGTYTADVATINTDTTFKLFSPKLGITYALNDQFNLFGAIAQSGQVPSESEIQSNTSLDAATARNFEIGLKGRAKEWKMDLSLYRTTVSDEIISVQVSRYQTEFQNAGETLKKGLELSGDMRLMDNLWLGAGYAYSDYTFTDFMEVVSSSGTFDRSGNYLPYVPKHQFNVSLDYNHPTGWKARLQADSWGEYYTDNSNAETYGGYDFLTSLMVGYEKESHSLDLNIDNLFDKRYATEVKGSGSSKSYSAGAPRSAMLTYTYTF